MGAKSYYLRVIQSDGIERKCKLISNNIKRVMMIQLLPSEYQEVEYLESSGTQFIDTGYKLSNNSSVDFAFSFSVSQTYCFIFGARVGASEKNIAAAVSKPSNPIYIDFNNSDYTTYRANFTGTIETDKIYKVLISKTSRALSDETGNILVSNTTSNNQSFTCTTNALLFDRNGPETGGNKLQGKIYYCKIWNNNTLVRDFIPCYRKSDNKPGMFDMVNKVFYTNVGSNDFTVGNNVY